MSRSCLALPVLALTGILAGPTPGASRPIAPVTAPAPAKLAVFDFELEDTSAAISEIASDATELANATEAVRQLLTQSGRYRVVATGSDAGGVNMRSMHDCGGCEAAIALRRPLKASEKASGSGVERCVWRTIDCTTANEFLTRWTSSRAMRRWRSSHCRRSVMSRMVEEKPSSLPFGP